MKKLGNGLAISMVAVLFLSMMTVFPVYAQPEIYMTPSTNPPPPGPYVSFLWNVTLWVTGYGNPPVFAFQVKLFFNPAAGITVTRAWLPAPNDPNYIFVGISTVRPTPAIAADNVLIGDSSLGAAATPPPEPAMLGIIEFHITAAPQKYETLYTLLDIDNPDTYLLDDALSEIPIIKTNGDYTWAWTPPTTLPHLEVMDDGSIDGTADNQVYFDKNFNQPIGANGTLFDVSVYLMQLDVGWALTNASFVLKFNTTIIDTEVANITINTADWDGPYDLSVTHGIPDKINITVRTTQSLSGDVLIATITFKVQNVQEKYPPSTTILHSPLDIQDEVLWDHAGTIDFEPSVDGDVYIEPLLVLPLPYLEVDDSEANPVNPEGELVICEQYGKTFKVKVNIQNLHLMWRLVGIQFRLSYDETLLRVVNVEEGDYLLGYPNRPDPPYTFFIWFDQPSDPLYGTHVLVGDLILPDDNGTWTNFPGGDWVPPETPPAEASGTLAIIEFEPLVQSWVDTYTCALDLVEIVLTNDNAEDIDFSEPQNGTYTILPIAPRGRWIDVWMVNPPNGGYGIHEPADLVVPQTEITLTAKVTYNWWPVQYKKVTFEIRDNHGNLVTILQADTGEDGHAYVTYRMPWPCEGAEDLLGKWNITVSVTLADVVITDWMLFDYDYLVRIWNVSTDKLEYAHSEDIEITVDYGTHAMREETVYLAVTIQDNLSVPIGVIIVEVTIGGAEFCHYANFTTTVTLHVVKWAYSGMATVRASFLNGLPSEWGEAVAQEVTTIIYILPC